MIGKILHGNSYLWSMMKKSSVSRMQRFMYFSDSVLCLGKMNQNPTSNAVWERQLGWFKGSSQCRTLDTIDGEPMEFEWNIFQGTTTLELVREVQKFLSKMGEPEQFQGRVILMSIFNDIKWERNVLLILYLCVYFQKDSHQDDGHSSDLDQKQSGILLTTKDHKENGTESLN